MRSLFLKITLKLKRKPFWLQIMILFLLSYAIVLSAIPLLLLTELIDKGNENGPNGLPIFIVVILAPLLETLLNQHLPFKLFQALNWTKNKYGLYVVVSAIIFGLCHYYSLRYIIFAFAVGLIWGYTYLFYSKSPGKAFWTTTLIHALRNSMTVLLAYFETIFS